MQQQNLHAMEPMEQGSVIGSFTSRCVVQRAEKSIVDFTNNNAGSSSEQQQFDSSKSSHSGKS